MQKIFSKSAKLKLYIPTYLKQNKAERRNRNEEDWKKYETEKFNLIKNYIKYERTINPN